MHFYAIYRHSWPDCTPYARILKAFSEQLIAEGHTVTVFCGQPSYNDIRQKGRPWREVVSGVEYIRMPLLWERKHVLLSRIVNSMLFCIGALLYGLFTRRIDVTMSVTSPPVIMGAVARYVARFRRSCFIYHCQDLHPEAGLAGGVLKDGVITRFMAALDVENVRVADLCIVLSEEMAESIRARGVDGNNIEVLNNFAFEPQDIAVRLPAALKRRTDIFRILFAGNHGTSQGLEQVIAAAHVLKTNPRIHFQFVGEGIVKSRLVELAGDLVGKTVSFHTHVTEEQAFRVMRESDLGIVSLQPTMFRYAYPSKAGTLLSGGCPLLAIIEKESSLARLVMDERLGVVCEPGHVSAVVAAIQDAYRQSTSWSSRERIRAVAEKHVEATLILQRWSLIVHQRCASIGDLHPA